MNKFLRAISNPRFLIVFAMGFASGLPLYLTGSTLSAWMRLEGINLKTIGGFSLVGFAYMFKFMWAPFLDRYVPPFLGLRRGWLLISQFGVILSILAYSFTSPAENILLIVVISVILAFFSATQDIVIDAYRREFLKPEEFGFGISLAVTGYRIGMFYAGSFAFILAGPEIGLSWNTTYQVMALGMLVGVIATFVAPEPAAIVRPPQTLRSAFIDPFKEYFAREGALWLLAFIVLYKIGDLMASAMTVPFYIDLKFTMTEIGAIGKVFGIWMLIGGGLVGGVIMLRLGIKRSLWTFGILQSMANLSFCWLAYVGNNPTALAIAISIESFTAGMGSTALSALMTALTNRRFTATQFALLSSLMSLPRIIIGPPAGFIAEYVSWGTFFVICTLAGIPGMLILLKIGKWADAAEHEQGLDSTATPST